MTDLEAFRQETRAWLEENAPRSLRGTRTGRFGGYWGGRSPQETTPDRLRWFEMMLERGWTAPTWPKRYGGGGHTVGEARVLSQELAALQLPPPLVGLGLTMIGPTLLDYGSEAQKQQHLPAIVRGEIRWCQGYSEPGAGSDLAAVQTQAIRDGDQFVLNGQKVWTSYADLSDWIFCLVRTNPEVKKQLGITFILVDMDTPGVSTRPITLISGASPFCEVFLDDVRVPADNVVGEVNAGWTVAKALLGYERSMIGEAISGQLSNIQAELVELARLHLDAPAGRLPDSVIRQRIASNAMDERSFMLTLERVRQQRLAGIPTKAGGISKIYGSELKQRRWQLAVDIAGPESLGWEGPGFSERALADTRDWLRSRANSIEGGSSEIQLNIIAKAILGLPTFKG